MLASRMLPVLWFRFVAVIAFAIFMAVHKVWIVVAIAMALAALTGWQIATAVRTRRAEREG